MSLYPTSFYYVITTLRLPVYVDILLFCRSVRPLTFTTGGSIRAVFPPQISQTLQNCPSYFIRHRHHASEYFHSISSATTPHGS